MTEELEVSRKAVGEASENIVLGRLMLLGLDIYRPAVDDKQIDAIIRVQKETHTIYYEVQIKSVKAYNSVVGVRNLHEKPKNYFLIIYYRHDKNKDEFYYLKLQQAKELWTGPDGDWKEVQLKKPERDKYKHQTLEHLAKTLLNK